MKITTFHARAAASLIFVTLIVYFAIVTQTDFMFGMGFITCLEISVIYIIVQAFRIMAKNYLVELRIDQEYVHLKNRSNKIIHIKISEIKQIIIKMHNGNSVNKYSKYADSIVFQTVFGEQYKLSQAYKRSGQVRNLYSMDSGGKRQTLNFDEVKSMITKENFPNTILSTNEIIN